MTAEPPDPGFERQVREAYGRPVPVPPLDEVALLRRLRQERGPRRGSPQRWVTLSLPLAAGVAAMILLAGVMVGVAIDRRAARPMAAHGGVELVHFALVAPRASQVAVVGDFNGWDTRATPMKKLASGETWTAAVAVPEGRYAYAFVIDGQTWLPDPTAPLAPGDGFGHESSVLVVPAARSSS